MHARSGPLRAVHGSIALFALGALFLLLQYVLPGIEPHPVRPDDYSSVAGTFADMGLQWKRPVSSNLIFMIAAFGPAASYAALCALAVVDAALVLWLLSRVFATRVTPVATGVFGLVVFSHASAFTHAIYLGLLTNLISHCFGLATLLALWRGWSTGRTAWLWFAAAAFALSALAKEDFLLPPLLLAALLALRAPGIPAPSVMATRRALWLALAAIAAIAAGSLLWHAHDRNPFVAGLFSPDTSAPIYAVDLSPGVLARAAWTLLCEFAPHAFAAAAAAWIAMFALAPRQRLPLLWYAATVLALVLPYAMISRNMPTFRVYAWLPWYAGLVAIALSMLDARIASRRPRAVLSAAAVAAALALAWAQSPPRAKAVAGYAQQSALNRRMVDSLRAHRAALAPAPAVGLVGLRESSPWCAQDATYVNRKLGFDGTKWIVFVPAPSRCYTQQAPDARRRRGIFVSVVALTRLCAYGDLPVLEFAADGSAVLRLASDYCAPAQPASS